MKTARTLSLIALVLALSMLFSGCALLDLILGVVPAPISLNDVPEFSGEPYVLINGGVPFFTAEELTDKSFESYSELDELGRCGVAVASIGRDIMPTEDRGDINSVKPSGWVSVKYDCISGGYLYHRCHLIGFQLTGENANEKNLITGTQYLNIEGMLDFENMIADYVEETGNHVLYRVTPIYEGYELVARGVLMEAVSVEDGGDGIQFNVYCYNNQPGVVINYFDGTSYLDGEAPPADEGNGGGDTDEEVTYYVLNIKTKKIHLPSCTYAVSMKAENKSESTKTIEELINEGHSACGVCKPK